MERLNKLNIDKKYHENDLKLLDYKTAVKDKLFGINFWKSLKLDRTRQLWYLLSSVLWLHPNLRFL